MITEIRKNLGFIALAAGLLYGLHWVLQRSGRGGLMK